MQLALLSPISCGCCEEVQKMKKKCLSILCLLLLFVSVALPVHAAGSSSRLVDNADYLTDSEEATLLNKLDEISTRQGLTS